MYEFFKNHPRGRVFHNVNLSNLENVLQKNLRTDRAREFIFRVFGDKNFEKYPLGTNHCGAFLRSMSVLICPKKIWIRQ